MNVPRICVLAAVAALLLGGTAAAQSGQNNYEQPNSQTVRVTQGPTVEYADDQFAVVSWTTDVSSDTRVYYGNDPNNLTRVAEGQPNTTTHRVHLSSLAPGAKYYFQLDDGQGANGSGPIEYFQTVAAGAPPIRNQQPMQLAKAAPQGPVITKGPNIQYSDDRSAVITWTTDKPAPNVVYYGTAPHSLTQTAEGREASTYHRINLLNLTPATTYFFQVETGQPAGTVLTTYNFQTVAAGGAPQYDRLAAQNAGPTTQARSVASAPPATTSSSPELQQRPREVIYKGGQLIPAGTEIHATLDSALSSKTSRAGDTFTATVTEPVTGQSGAVAIPAGSKLRGQVSNVEQGKIIPTLRGKARMDVRFNDVVLPNGTTLPITATLLGVSDKAGAKAGEEGQVTDTTQGKEVAKDVGIGAGLGTVAGLLFGSALKGLAIGALAGGGYILATQGRDVQLPRDSQLNIRLDHQLSVPPAGTNSTTTGEHPEMSPQVQQP
jgi:hypothetical protein